MIDRGHHPILGVQIDAVDYAGAVQRIIDAARERRPCSVSALAVHGVMESLSSPDLRRRLNGLDLVVPDGQPVRWALDWIHDIPLPDRVYGPTLMLRTIEKAAESSISVYFYGSTETTVSKLVRNLEEKYPDLEIAGWEPSKFRRLTEEERKEVTQRIKSSGARIVFVGLGCPRQEVWAYEYREALSVPILAVGAAFDFHAGTLSQAPSWMQDNGLEWLYRLLREPKRLWRRNLLLPPAYLFHVALQVLSLKMIPVLFPTGEEELLSYG